MGDEDEAWDEGGDSRPLNRSWLSWLLALLGSSAPGNTSDRPEFAHPTTNTHGSGNFRCRHGASSNCGLRRGSLKTASGTVFPSLGVVQPSIRDETLLEG